MKAGGDDENGRWGCLILAVLAIAVHVVAMVAGGDVGIDFGVEPQLVRMCNLVEYVSKPIPIWLMAKSLNVPSGGSDYQERMVKYTRLGLLFSSLGDILLLPVKPFDNFIGGLSAFFVAHVLYIFRFGFADSVGQLNVLNAVLLCVPFTALAGGMLSVLLPHIPSELVGPVIGYALIIAVFGCTTMFNMAAAKTWERGRTHLCLGAILFMISDSVLAMNKFHPSMVAFGAVVPHVIVMATYYGAQLLAAHGALYL